MWDQYFYDSTSIEQKRLAILIHSLAAIVIICIWIVHVYAAIWARGTIRGMTRGYVTGGWGGAITANGCVKCSPGSPNIITPERPRRSESRGSLRMTWRVRFVRLL
jgi:hypothetical protein